MKKKYVSYIIGLSMIFATFSKFTTFGEINTTYEITADKSSNTINASVIANTKDYDTQENNEIIIVDTKDGTIYVNIDYEKINTKPGNSSKAYNDRTPIKKTKPTEDVVTTTIIVPDGKDEISTTTTTTTTSTKGSKPSTKPNTKTTIPKNTNTTIPRQETVETTVIIPVETNIGTPVIVDEKTTETILDILSSIVIFNQRISVFNDFSKSNVIASSNNDVTTVESATNVNSSNAYNDKTKVNHNNTQTTVATTTTETTTTTVKSESVVTTESDSNNGETTIIPGKIYSNNVDASSKLESKYISKSGSDVRNYELGQDLFSNKVNMEGLVLSFPCTFSQLKANGWEIGDINTNVQGNQISTVPLVQNKRLILANIKNNDKETKSAIDTNIVGIEIDNLDFSDITNIIKFELPKGINNTSKLENVVKAYGEPNEIGNTGNTIFYTYWKNGNPNSFVKFGFNQDTKSIVKVELSIKE